MSNLNNIEINKTCRTCLTAAEDMKSLYEADLASKQICLAELLMTCTPLKCYKNDGLPTTICHNCIEDLKRCDTFQTKCLQSDETLRSHNHLSDITKVENNPISISASLHCSDTVIEPTIKSLKQECDMIKREQDMEEDIRIFEEVFVNTEFPDSNSKLMRLHSPDISVQESNIKTEKCLKDPLTIGELDLITHEVDFQIKLEKEEQNELIITKLSAINSEAPNLIGDKSINTNVNISKTSSVSSSFTNDATAVTVPVQNQPGEKQYSCTVCNSSFKLKKYLTSHMRKHSNEKPYACTVCSKLFGYKQNLDVHMRMHSGERPYPCTTCDNAFKTTQQLKYHMRTHTGEKPYTCKVCNLVFGYRQSVKVHMRMHSGEKPHRCTDCNLSFGLKHTLTIHMRTHTKEKPYVCTVCDSSFKQWVYLKAHMRRHTGEKLYTCTVCDKSFKQSRSLTGHMRIHTGEKPYLCTVCDSSFTTKQNLMYHALTHTREKPFTCAVCNKTFKQKWQLQKHKRKHTREKQ